jgi:hypothetical protein
MEGQYSTKSVRLGHVCSFRVLSFIIVNVDMVTRVCDDNFGLILSSPLIWWSELKFGWSHFILFYSYSIYQV